MNKNFAPLFLLDLTTPPPFPSLMEEYTSLISWAVSLDDSAISSHWED